MLKNISKIWVLFIASMLCLFIAIVITDKNTFTTQELVKTSETLLHDNESRANGYLKSISDFLENNSPSNLFSNAGQILPKLKEQDEISIYAFNNNDSLCFWTENEPAIDVLLKNTISGNKLLKLRNGWYETLKLKNNDLGYTFIALIKIKPEYDFENKYLKNDFSSWINLPKNTELRVPANYPIHTVKSKSGVSLFEVYRSDGVYKSPSLNYASFIFFGLGFIFFLLGLYFLLKAKIKNDFLFFIMYACVCFIIRTCMIYYKFPVIFYSSDLYNASIFANASSFYFSFMGDIFINSFLIFLLSIFIYTSQINVSKIRVIAFSVFILCFLIVLVFFTFNVRYLIYSLVNNTTITYNINELFNYTGYSIVGYLSTGFFVFSFYLLIDKLLLIGLNYRFFTRSFLIIFLVVIIGSYILLTIYDLPQEDYLWSIALIVISFFIRKYKSSYNFINVGFIILVSTIIIANFFTKYEQFNKKQTYDALALTLTDKQDFIAENEFIKASRSIQSDSKLKKMLDKYPTNIEEIDSQLRQVNFSGYFERYDIVLSLFKNDSTPILNASNPIYWNELYFKNQINYDGKKTICDNLFFIDKNTKTVKYISEIKIDALNKHPKSSYRLYIQLEQKNANNLGPFLDLLLDKTTEHKLESRQLSYAIYENNKISSSYGDYQYPLLIDDVFFEKNDDVDFEHYVYLNKDNSKVIITDKKIGFWQKLTSNSYLFVFFSVLVLSSLLIYSIVIKRNYRFGSLNNRIKFIFVFIVVASLTTVVFATVWIVTNQFEINNKKELISKSQSVLKEISQTLGQQDALDVSYKRYTISSLKKLAQLFGSDISLYNSKGELFATSQPAIYEKGLMSKIINPLAYACFNKEIVASYLQKESIGELSYLSAYLPFYNKNDKLLGYINLPYYSRQKDLEKELTAYLTTLINIYTILISITTLMALVVSNFLTKPLRIIKQQISNIKFGKHNEELKWKTKDEIGDLVIEYNNMLVKLERNSELLAKSERESAWREMAKQVAHEIKNPLTPMKLNIQHLQRVAASNPEDMKERVGKVSEILIEQIDTLSHIATEFSNFAKLPNTTLETVNLLEILENVSQLFKQNTNCSISLLANEQLYIRADKEQCLRIFTNLLKNAEQAIPEGRLGVITIELYKKNDNAVVTVEDNGSGISDNLKHKLFTPNFTTKSTGTGLGLAMVKNSVVSFNGTISVDTEEMVGTTFTLVFPLEKL